MSNTPGSPKNMQSLRKLQILRHSFDPLPWAAETEGVFRRAEKATDSCSARKETEKPIRKLFFFFLAEKWPDILACVPTTAVPKVAQTAFAVEKQKGLDIHTGLANKAERFIDDSD